MWLTSSLSGLGTWLCGALTREKALCRSLAVLALLAVDKRKINFNDFRWKVGVRWYADSQNSSKRWIAGRSGINEDFRTNWHQGLKCCQISLSVLKHYFFGNLSSLGSFRFISPREGTFDCQQHSPWLCLPERGWFYFMF